MTSRVLAPSLAAAVDRAKDQARASGELRVTPVGVTESPFEPEERALITAWRSSGEYDESWRTSSPAIPILRPDSADCVHTGSSAEGAISSLDPMTAGFADELARYAGRWVALDYARRRVLADADSKETLLARIEADGIRGSVILEVPRADTPSLVGLG